MSMPTVASFRSYRDYVSQQGNIWGKPKPSLEPPPPSLIQSKPPQQQRPSISPRPQLPPSKPKYNTPRTGIKLSTAKIFSICLHMIHFLDKPHSPITYQHPDSLINTPRPPGNSPVSHRFLSPYLIPNLPYPPSPPIESTHPASSNHKRIRVTNNKSNKPPTPKALLIHIYIII